MPSEKKSFKAGVSVAVGSEFGSEPKVAARPKKQKDDNVKVKSPYGRAMVSATNPSSNIERIMNVTDTAPPGLPATSPFAQVQQPNVTSNTKKGWIKNASDTSPLGLPATCPFAQVEQPEVPSKITNVLNGSVVVSGSRSDETPRNVIQDSSHADTIIPVAAAVVEHSIEKSHTASFEEKPDTENDNNSFITRIVGMLLCAVVVIVIAVTAGVVLTRKTPTAADPNNSNTDSSSSNISPSEPEIVITNPPEEQATLSPTTAPFLRKSCLVETPDTFLGDGECRRESGGYPLKFSKSWSNSDWCRKKCCETDWCLAAEFTTSQRECRLVTDVETFEAAGYALQSTDWAAEQIIDGDRWITYCSGGGLCTDGSTEFEGGSLNPRSGYQCWMSTSRVTDTSLFEPNDNVPPTPFTTKKPTSIKTPLPTSYATKKTSPVPSSMPTTPKPTSTPTPLPTFYPTKKPSPAPSGMPTTPKPTSIPTPSPTRQPTAKPTPAPTKLPTPSPTTCLSANPDVFLGDGECRSASGEYPLTFSKAWSNSDWCRKKCCHLDWCLAVEFTSSQSECHLVTDVETFEGAGYTLQSTAWGADQIIDGDTWTTYCNGGSGGCTAGSTRYEGGSLNPRSGYKCWTSASSNPPPSCIAEKPDTFLGNGECRQESGGYPLTFSKAWSNSDWCREKCCKTNWCLAAEFTSSQSECHLVTDVETFEAAGYTLQSTAWAADQIIDGDTWKNYCNGGGVCTAGSTRFEGGSLSTRSGYQCWIG